MGVDKHDHCMWRGGESDFLHVFVDWLGSCYCDHHNMTITIDDHGHHHHYDSPIPVVKQCIHMSTLITSPS
jgi:hypothetical protein